MRGTPESPARGDIGGPEALPTSARWCACRGAVRAGPPLVVGSQDFGGASPSSGRGLDLANAVAGGGKSGPAGGVSSGLAGTHWRRPALSDVEAGHRAEWYEASYVE